MHLVHKVIKPGVFGRRISAESNVCIPAVEVSAVARGALDLLGAEGDDEDILAVLPEDPVVTAILGVGDNTRRVFIEQVDQLVLTIG